LEKKSEDTEKPIECEVKQAKRVNLIEFGDHLPANFDHETDDDNEDQKKQMEEEEEEGKYEFTL
jgi:hypothetical protein